MLRRTENMPYTISDLPQEILPSIFKYLTTSERKAVKLVCKSWFEACNAFSLLDEEFLNCLGVYSPSDIYGLLHRSQRRHLSLKFVGVTFSYSEFWNRNGRRVQSIDFVNCHFLSGSLRCIFLNCPLLHLSFTYTLHFAELNSASEPPIKGDDLDEIVELRLNRSNLQSLEIYVGNPNKIKMSNYIISQLFAIFPNVKILKVTCDDSTPVYDEEFPDYIGDDLTDLFNKNDFTIAPVLNYLTAAADRMEKLKLHFTCFQFPLQDFLHIFVAMKRLTELSIEMGNSPLVDDMNALFECSKHLKSLEFKLVGVDVDDDGSFHSVLLQTLLSNSSFKNLSVSCRGPPMTVSRAVFEKLISSGPQNLSLSVIFISFDAQLITQNTPTPSTNLSLRLCQPEEDSLSFCLQKFRNLSHLELFRVTDQNLETLFKYKLKLKTLIIGTCLGGFLQDRLNNFRSRINQLTDVEYMNLADPVGDIFLKCLSPEPILANLKYLDINSVEDDPSVLASNFLKAAEAMPFLEGLRIKYEKPVSYDFCVELCSKLNRLRYFNFMGDWFIGERFGTYIDYQQFFSLCPSLRALVHWTSEELMTFFFDTIRNKVSWKETDGQVVFSRPKVGDGFVEWLILF